MTISRNAATAVLIRDGESHPEVLMLKRSSHGVFGNMWVFPGGGVEPGDNIGGELDSARAAAVREASEETGLTVRPDRLLPISHWTPPEGFPTRFLTWFFIARVENHPVAVDGHEIIDHVWSDAATILARHHQGQMAMAPPTVVTLTEIACHKNCEKVLAFYRERGIFRYVPRFVKAADGNFVSLYPGDAGYRSGEIETSGNRNRLVLQDGICTYEMDFANDDLSRT